MSRRRGRGSPREREDGGRKGRGDRSPEERRGNRRRNKRGSRRRRSNSPRRRSASLSPRRGDRRRNRNRSRSPRRRRNRHSSRSPARRNRGRRGGSSRSPRRTSRSRSPNRRRRIRSPKRRGRRNRRRRGSSSTSRSPKRRSRGRHRRSSRRRDFSSSSSSGRSTSVGGRRRRRRRFRNPLSLVYRVGDEVEFKKYGGRRRRSKWVPAEVDKIHRGGMYGELTYNVWLLDSERMEEYVRAEELRFLYPEDLEKRRRDDEIARCREDLRQINLKLARQQRERGFSRGRSDERQGVWTKRARSVDEDAHFVARPDRQEPRSMSVPPANWPEFLAEYAKNQFLGNRGGNQRSAPAEEIDYGYNNNAEFHGKHVPSHDEHIYENERDNRGLRGSMDHRIIVDDVNHGGDRVADHLEIKRTHFDRPARQNREHSSENRKNNKTERIDAVGKHLNLNFYLRAGDAK